MNAKVMGKVTVLACLSTGGGAAMTELVLVTQKELMTNYSQGEDRRERTHTGQLSCVGIMYIHCSGSLTER